MKSILKKIYSQDVLFVSTIITICGFGLIGVNLLEVIGFTPCALCKIQRFIIMSIIAFSSLGLSVSFLLPTKKYSFLASMIVSVGVLISFLFSLYQIGVEFGVFELPSICEVIKTNITTSQELFSVVSHPCNIPQYLLGFSIATWTFIGTSFLLCFVLGFFVQNKFLRTDKKIHLKDLG